MFNFLRHVLRAVLSVRPKRSHRCISLKESLLNLCKSSSMRPASLEHSWRKMGLPQPPLLGSASRVGRQSAGGPSSPLKIFGSSQDQAQKQHLHLRQISNATSSLPLCCRPSVCRTKYPPPLQKYYRQFLFVELISGGLPEKSVTAKLREASNLPFTWAKAARSSTSWSSYPQHSRLGKAGHEAIPTQRTSWSEELLVLAAFSQSKARKRKRWVQPGLKLRQSLPKVLS